MKHLYRAVFRRADVEAEMDAEMRHHIELETEELVRGGMSADDAKRTALLTFGGVQQQKEEALEGGSLVWLEGLRRDVRIATKTLLRHRTFAISATLALALAIAVNTTLFSMIDAMINPSISARAPEQLYQLRYFGDPRKKVDFYEREQAFKASLGMHQAYTEWSVSGVGSVERKVVAEGAISLKVRANYFATVGAKPLLGRLQPGADVGDNSPVVISNVLQARLFGQDEFPIGAFILLDGAPHPVIGVVESFAGLPALNADVWIFTPPTEQLPFKLIRLKDGTTLEVTQRRLGQLAAQIALATGDDPKSSRFHLVPLRRQFHVQRFHYALIGAGIAILVVACTNLANLQLARGLTRTAELAVRSALGATRRQIVTQLLIESGVLATAALVLALLLTIAGNAILAASVPPNVGAYVVGPQSSWRMVVVAALAAVVCLFSIGLFPALRISRVNLNAHIKGRAGTGQHRSNRRIYGLLIVVQIALTLPLACAAVLLSRSALRAADIEFQIGDLYGFDPRPVLAISIPLPTDTMGRKLSLGSLSEELIARVKAVGGVTHAALSVQRTYGNSAVTVDSDDGSLREIDAPLGRYLVVSAEYLKVFGFTLDKGHDFGAMRHADAPVIVDVNTVEALWPHSEPIGRLIKFSTRHSAERSLRVTGVMGDQLTEAGRERKRALSTTRVGQVVRLISEGDSIGLSRYRQSITMYARVEGDPAKAVEAIRRGMRGESAAPPIVRLFTESLGVTRTMIVTRFVAGLFTVFGVLALLLSALGVYAIVAHSVNDRRREVAVRIALGATPRTIIRALIREGNVLVLAGIAVGLLMTKYTVSWIELFLGTVDIYSAPFFAAMCVGLFVTMAMAALVPAIRATKLDMMEVLRAE